VIGEHRRLIAVALAALTGALLIALAPVDASNPFLTLVSLRRPMLYFLLTKSYLLFLFTTPWIIYSTALSLMFVHAPEPSMERTGAIPLPRIEDPLERSSLYVVLGERHKTTKREPVLQPTWLTIPEKGLYTGVACFGAIGSGKTSSFIRPVALQLFRYAARDRARRLGGLVLEVKGDFCHQVRDMLRASGREEDYNELSLETEWRYNALNNPQLSEDALAYAVITLIANIYGKGKDPFWPMASQNCIKFLILLHRLVFDYVTLLDVYYCAINPTLLNERVEVGMKKYGIQDVVEIAAKDWADAAAKVQQFPAFEQDPETHAWRHPYKPELDKTLKAANIPHRRTEISTQPAGVDLTKLEQFVAVRRWLVHDWTAIDTKLRTSIVEGISVFLSLFDTDPAVKRIFCPPKETYDPAKNVPDPNGVYPYGRPFPTFSDLIEEGRVVALNFPVSLNPVVARTIGILMKLDYQRAVLLRIPKMAAEPKRHFRPTLFVVDEYQLFVTAGESGTGDAAFFSLSRQPKCIGLIATQSIVSLKGALSSDDAYKTLLQTFRSKIFLNTADDVTAEYASRMCGREDQVQTSLNIGESDQNATVSAITGNTHGDKASVTVSKSFSLREKDRFPMRAFYGLRNAEAIALAFDGVNPIPSSYLYLKPWYLPTDVSWFDQYERGMLS
jgi:hypothetical protein